MNTINDQLATVLGMADAISLTPTANAVVVLAAPLPPVLFVPPAPPVPLRTDQVTQAENDAEYARDNLYDVIKKTSILIGEMIPVANQSQAPRAYEVINSLLNTQRDTAALLLKLQSDRSKLRVGTGGPGTPLQAGNVTIANAIFVGTSSELLDLIKGKNRVQEDQIRDAEFLVDDEE